MIRFVFAFSVTLFAMSPVLAQPVKDAPTAKHSVDDPETVVRGLYSEAVDGDALPMSQRLESLFLRERDYVVHRLKDYAGPASPTSAGAETVEASPAPAAPRATTLSAAARTRELANAPRMHAASSMRQVRKTPSWSRSWANFIRLQLYSHRNA